MNRSTKKFKCRWCARKFRSPAARDSHETSERNNQQFLYLNTVGFSARQLHRPARRKEL